MSWLKTAGCECACLSYGAQGKGRPRTREFGAGASGGLGKGVATGIVIVVGGEQFVAATEMERAHDCVDCGGGVGDKDQLLRARPDKAGQGGAGRLQTLL